MVVDDEEFCLSTMKAQLTLLKVNYKNICDFCITGKEALDKVEEVYKNGQKYKLILTDFSMPVLDGI